MKKADGLRERLTDQPAYKHINPVSSYCSNFLLNLPLNVVEERHLKEFCQSADGSTNQLTNLI